MYLLPDWRRLPRHVDALAPRQIGAGQRGRRALDVLGRARGDDASAVHAGARPHVDDVVGGHDRFVVVLNDKYGVAEVAQLAQRVEQARVVPLVQPNGRLVENVQHAHQRRADLRRQPDALRLAARQRRRGAIEREVLQPDVDQEVQSVGDLAQDALGDRLLARRQRQLGEELVRIADRQPRELMDRQVADFDEAGFFAQARAAALFRRARRFM